MIFLKLHLPVKYEITDRIEEDGDFGYSGGGPSSVKRYAQ
jgi:hypothetical protein